MTKVVIHMGLTRPYLSFIDKDIGEYMARCTSLALVNNEVIIYRRITYIEMTRPVEEADYTQIFALIFEKKEPQGLTKDNLYERKQHI